MGLKIIFRSFIETCHSWQPYLKRIDAPVLRCPGMAKQKVGNPKHSSVCNVRTCKQKVAGSMLGLLE